MNLALKDREITRKILGFLDGNVVSGDMFEYLRAAHRREQYGHQHAAKRGVSFHLHWQTC